MFTPLWFNYSSVDVNGSFDSAEEELQQLCSHPSHINAKLMPKKE